MAEISASASPISTKNTSVEDIRRSVTYHPSIWKDHFLSYTSDVTDICAAEKEQLEKQKEKVKKLLVKTPNDSTFKIELIDAIQRLGVGYHFEKEIDESLRQIHDTYQIIQSSKDNDDLHVVSLHFRLLRQQGYRVPCDVFNKFMDDEGNFEESLIKDVEGMLSLYEASNCGVNGEEIVDKALEFSSSHLKSLVPQLTTSLSRRVKEALEVPISKTLNRLGAKKFISTYQENESHDEDLLNFAKLDFNIVQKGHQKELNHITRWWKDTDFVNKLPFARDRVVEGFFWMSGVYFEPHYSIARKFITKITAMTTILDDIYDVHGTLDELRHFTNIIPSWDISACDELPPYMRIYYRVLLGVYAEMEGEMAKQGESYRVQYAKQEMVTLAKAYMEEAEWCYSKYSPKLDEYVNLGISSSAHAMLATTSLVGMPEPITNYDFDWITNDPKILRTSAFLGRLMDDLAGYGTEKKITAIDCYMSENGCSEKKAISALSKQVKEAWNVINEEWLEPRAASNPILMRIINLTRVLCIMYFDIDGYTNPTTRVKDNIKALFVHPIH